jgi:hypothetical protein
MLIKITNRCSMGCSHCMEDSTPAGEHMDRDTFDRALDCADRLEALAIAAGYQLLLLGGGECTEHPAIVEYVNVALERGRKVILLSNGMWLSNNRLRNELLRDGVAVQVTNDPRFYPRVPPRITHARVAYVGSLSLLTPMGRHAGKGPVGPIPLRHGPTSFNLRSITRATNGDIRVGIAHLRLRAMQGSMASGHCTPSISADGAVRVGESNACYELGTVDSSPEEMSRALDDMRCNRCGLVDNLSPEQARAIGERR